MDREERGYILLAHLSAAIPLWGILFNGILWLSFKEKSRKVVFHAHQGIFFQVIFLAALLVGLIAFLFIQLIAVVNGSLAAILGFGNWVVMAIVWAAYEITCFYAMWSIVQGRDFEYPLVGAKLRGNTSSIKTSNLED